MAGPVPPGSGTSTAQALSAADGATLAGLAVEAVRRRLTGEPPAVPAPTAPALRNPGASFVTLMRQERLLGCIGTLETDRPLYLDVMRNARHAMTDPRLPPVTAADWPELSVEVSVLTTPEPLPVHSMSELVAVLRPGVDGLILDDSSRRATFLPAVWQSVPRPEEFVERLLVKGGWGEHRWPDELRVRRYSAEEYHDEPPRPPIGPDVAPT